MLASHAEIIEELGPKRALAAALHEKLVRAQRKQQQGRGGLLNFVRHFWRQLEPVREFQDGWALAAMCEHLEAITAGIITRALINVPPGSMKSLLVNVFWPAWEWGPMNLPHLRYISFSYASHLTERDNQRFLDLVASREYRRLWGDVFDLKEKGKVKVSNTRTGWKFASSVGGVGTGERADRVLLDDPHNVKESESDTVRSETVRWFKEAMSNRLNDMTASAIIVIMQRVHEDDVSGVIIAGEMGYDHLCIPMEYEHGRPNKTRIGWRDPRAARNAEGECFWPERFPPAAVAECKLLGEHVYAGQYQQRPEPRGGGMIKRAYWQLWDPPKGHEFHGKFPKLDYLVASLDSAFTEKTQNDPSGFTIWGGFRDEHGNRAAILVHAWRKHLSIYGSAPPPMRGETADDYKARTSEQWGIVQWVGDSCRRFKVDRLLVENKASGHDVANELRRLFKSDPWTVDLIDPKGMDKIARASRVIPIFAGGLIYYVNRAFAKMVIDEMATFENGRFKDLTDSGTQAIWWLRQNNWLILDEERRAELLGINSQKPDLKAELPLYPA